MAQLSAQQLARAFAQGGGLVPSAGFNSSNIYNGILPSMGGGNPALNAINAASPSIPNRPASWSSYDVASGAPLASSGASLPPLPRRSPISQPNRMDVAAMSALPGMVPGAIPVPRATAAAPPGYQLGDGLISMLTGGKTQGLAGMFGDPEQGGLLQMLFGGNKQGGAPAVKRAPMTYGQRYGEGSVAAMEAQHSGRPAGAYTDSRTPSGTGSLW